mgnify:FL=1
MRSTLIALRSLAIIAGKTPLQMCMQKPKNVAFCGMDNVECHIVAVINPGHSRQLQVVNQQIWEIRK